MSGVIASLMSRVSELERRVKGAARQGVVQSVDPVKGTCRVSLSEGGVLSPSIPYAQTGGALKFHNPPSVGQQMMLLSPDGEMRNAIALPLGFSDAEPSPNENGDEHQITFGSVSVLLKSNEVKITVGGVSLKITDDGADFTGGYVQHNGTTIDDTHTHGGIVSGGSRTNDPK